MLISHYKPVIVLGAGGHAKVVLDTLASTGRAIMGIVTRGGQSGDSFCGYDILGDDETLTKLSPDDVELANGIGSLPGQNTRWKLASQYRNLGFCFTNIIHPSAIIADDVEVSDGVQIMLGAIIQSGSVIGRDSIINTGVILDHDCVVGVNCHLASGVVCSGAVNFGEKVHVGTGSSVIQNISIGSDSIVAAGSVLYEDVPSGVTYIQPKNSKIISGANFHV